MFDSEDLFREISEMFERPESITPLEAHYCGLRPIDVEEGRFDELRATSNKSEDNSRYLRKVMADPQRAADRRAKRRAYDKQRRMVKSMLRCTAPGGVS